MADRWGKTDDAKGETPLGNFGIYLLVAAMMVIGILGLAAAWAKLLAWAPP